MQNLLLTGRIPSKRALATITKLRGMRLERRWPFLIKSEGEALNLGFEDLLEFQYARSQHFLFISVGAFDGLSNDPISRFVQNHRCHGILLEPQVSAFEQLCGSYAAFSNFKLLNMAIDEVSGSRDIFYIPRGIDGLPDWTEQLASFSVDHVLKHEEIVEGLSAHIQSQTVETISFGDLLKTFKISKIDVLQIDAEGMDAQLLEWFPFEQVKPSILHFETAHMTSADHLEVRDRLESYGYFVREADSALDDMAVII
ncbi:MAG: FkbM family methyltransferase [Verrucomicrobia bacterium]|nr:FkbM family methyltransferase [Verrucomicrobiota bacterium]